MSKAHATTLLLAFAVACSSETNSTNGASDASTDATGDAGLDATGDALDGMNVTDATDANSLDGAPDASDGAPAQSACSDGIDNDGDGLVDMADDGCSGADDGEERVGLGFHPPTSTNTALSSDACGGPSGACAQAFARKCTGGSCQIVTAGGVTQGQCVGGANDGLPCMATVTDTNLAYANTTVRYLMALGYFEISGHDATYDCIDFVDPSPSNAPQQIDLTGANNTIQCFSAGGNEGMTAGAGNGFYVFKVRAGADGTIFQDGVIANAFHHRDPWGYSEPGAGGGTRYYDRGMNSFLLGPANVTIRRLEWVRTAGTNGGPGAGKTISMSNLYTHDQLIFAGEPAGWFCSGPGAGGGDANCTGLHTCSNSTGFCAPGYGTHAEVFACENSPGGIISIDHSKISIDPDVFYGSGATVGEHAGWTGAFKVQYNNGGTALFNIWENLMTAPAPLANLFYTYGFNSGQAGQCPGPINLWNNRLIHGTSGYFDTGAGGVPEACGLCAHGATKVYGNTDSVTGAPVVGPGGDCGP
jgi:hypothetical protein